MCRYKNVSKVVKSGETLHLPHWDLKASEEICTSSDVYAKQAGRRVSIHKFHIEWLRMRTITDCKESSGSSENENCTGRRKNA